MKKEQEIKIYTNYITLGSFLKFIGIVGQGSDVKNYLLENKIFVNNETENRRGKKIYPGSIIEINSIKYLISKTRDNE
ncbi:MAG: S4 domain-containing protein YaaA [Ureaplasma sp.]|nr:S4 domain-containing protein YaaA [Ureaplasma sp.]MDE7221931.1 S4 domain-containing protein YaaA [Ureaplasma sp.]